MQENDSELFWFHLPVWFVGQDAVESPDGTWRFSGVAKCTVRDQVSACLFTDEDLAQTHMDMAGAERLDVCKISTLPNLIDLLLKFESAGYRYVTFDPNIKSGRSTNQSVIRDVIRQLQG